MHWDYLVHHLDYRWNRDGIGSESGTLTKFDSIINIDLVRNILCSRLFVFTQPFLLLLVRQLVEWKKVQQGVTMIMMFIMVGFFVSFFSFSNPNGTLATVSSFIPFFSPMVMFTRIVLGQPPVLQIAASVIILLISIVISTWLAARIYRVGILLYGKRLSIKEIFRYLIEPGY